jgi:PHD/YefM family antitoxin component YafN of YafNO toxin-antitoxin module
MIRPEDIGSLTDFQRNTRAHLKRLRRTGRPELLTVNGKAEVVVQNASAYQRLIELLEKLKRDSSAGTLSVGKRNACARKAPQNHSRNLRA